MATLIVYHKMLRLKSAENLDAFSGIGDLGVRGRGVGLLMVDRPTPADLQWLEEVEATLGECDRGVVARRLGSSGTPSVG